MDLNLKNKSFLVCGATSGFGGAVAHKLLDEGAEIIAVARDKGKLQELAAKNSGRIKILDGDLTEEKTTGRLFTDFDLKKISGALINAGGPPAMQFHETSIEDWDDAYRKLLRWKVLMTQKLIPILEENKYGRLLYIESASVKQPIENLILSNSLRMAVVGMVKSIARDLIAKGVTLNILAPGYHETQAVERLITKKAENEGLDYSSAKKKIEAVIPSGKMGSTEDFASIATWLLSEKSGYISGQTISVDGGIIKHVFG